jgi:hypothetical protein
MFSYAKLDYMPQDPAKKDYSCFVVHCKKSKFDIYIGRPSIFGNPYSHKEGTTALYKTETRDEAVEKYAEWLSTQEDILREIPTLKGKILGCWCSPQLCHGLILAELANGE